MRNSNHSLFLKSALLTHGDSPGTLSFMDALPDFNKTGGLVPVVAQDAESGEVLMLAWMNKAAWNETMATGWAVYWSRSRSRIWKKGESSGHKQRVREILLDCDRDSVVLKVDQIGGAACHTGRRSCFHNRVEGQNITVISEPLFDPVEIYRD